MAGISRDKRRTPGLGRATNRSENVLRLPDRGKGNYLTALAVRRARLSVCARDCAHLTSGVTEILLAYDVVALKDFARSMSGDAHGNRLGDAISHHVPHSGSPKVVEEHCGVPRSLARILPCNVKHSHRTTTTVKQVAGDDAANPPPRVPLCNRLPGLRGQVDHPSLASLGEPPQAAVLNVYLATFQTKQFRLPPSDPIGDRGDVAKNLLPKLSSNVLECLALEEAFAGILNSEQFDVWRSEDLLALESDNVGALQSGQFEVDSSRFAPGRLPLNYIPTHVCARNLVRAPVAEELG